MQHRRDEILAKKARLAELKRHRELRRDEFSRERQSSSGRDTSEPPASGSARGDPRRDLDSFISTLVDTRRPSSTGPRDASSGPTSAKDSRPGSIAGADDLEKAGPAGSVSIAAPDSAGPVVPETLSTVPPRTIYESIPSAPKQSVTYSKAVQTSESWSPPRRRSEDAQVESDTEASPSRSAARNSKRLSRRERESEKVLRAAIRREIGDEAKVRRDVSSADLLQQNGARRVLNDDEINAITASEEFSDFVDRSTKVIERALEEDYDVLADYALGQVVDDDDDDDYDNGGGGGGNDGYDGTGVKGRRRLRELVQFWDGRWSKRRMITSVNFSPKFPELLLSSHTTNASAPHDPDGILQVWNLHLPDRPEYVFHAQSDILVAKFSPFHPNLMVGGTYSGEVLLWDTRTRWSPVQKSPLTGAGHTHPVYAVDIVGTQNAHNIVSCSTDGTVCGWAIDMLAQPQESFELTPPPSTRADILLRIDSVAPTCMAFPRGDPTYFLIGTEEGAIYACHRYDRANAKAGVDPSISYRGHAAPLTSVQYHPGRGPIDLEDLVLSSSLDWSVKLWKVRAPAAVSGVPVAGAPHVARPILDLSRDDIVYDAAWSPVKPGVFAVVDGAGHVEIWDITVDTEVPVAKARPSEPAGRDLSGGRSLNRVAWEGQDGKRLAVGGLSGAVTVFEVGTALGGRDSARPDEWTSVKRLVNRLVGGGGSSGGGVSSNAGNATGKRNSAVVR